MTGHYLPQGFSVALAPSCLCNLADGVSPRGRPSAPLPHTTRVPSGLLGDGDISPAVLFLTAHCQPSLLGMCQPSDGFRYTAPAARHCSLWHFLMEVKVIITSHFRNLILGVIYFLFPLPVSITMHSSRIVFNDKRVCPKAPTNALQTPTYQQHFIQG